MLDAEGEFIFHGEKDRVEIVTESDYFNMGLVEALRVSGEEYEKHIDAIISSAYLSQHDYSEYEFHVSVWNWLIIKDDIHAHVASHGVMIDGELSEQASSDRLDFLKFS